jgi:DNA-binding phage protein
MSTLDTSYRDRRLARRLEDRAFRAEYERAQREIAQIDAVMRELDCLREEVGLSKAELARRIGKEPASVRRLFSSEANPQLATVVAIAEVLGARVQIKPPRRHRHHVAA